MNEKYCFYLSYLSKSINISSETAQYFVKIRVITFAVNFSIRLLTKQLFSEGFGMKARLLVGK